MKEDVHIMSRVCKPGFKPTGQGFSAPQNLSPGGIKGSGIWQVEGDLLVVAGCGDGASPSIKKTEGLYLRQPLCLKVWFAQQ